MLNYSSRARIVKEAVAVHPDAVHYGPHEGSHKQFKIHKVGSNFADHVKTGDVVKSSEIDDLADAGAKLRMVKPKAMKEEVEQLDEAGFAKGDSVSFTHAQSGKKMTGTYVKKISKSGRPYAHVEMGREAYHVPFQDVKKHVKEAVEIEEAMRAKRPAKQSVSAAYASLHSELGDHIKKLQKMHKDMDASKVPDLHWGHVGTLHDRLQTIKRVTDPDLS